MNILVTGAHGQLGSELKKRIACLSEAHFFFTDVEDLDISSSEVVLSFVRSNAITHVVNCAAYTAVDKAEQEVDKAFAINAGGVEVLAECCYREKIFLIHISTDYIFDGTSCRPYREDDLPCPTSVYGRSKLAGEEAMMRFPCGLILRTSWLYSNFGQNFVFTMQRLGREKAQLSVVYDQVGTPTFAGHLAEAIWKIIPQLTIWSERVEVYHFSNEGVCSWYDFASEIMVASKLSCRVLPILSASYPTAASRPHYSVLDKSKIKRDFNIHIPHWKEAFYEMISNQ